MRKVRLLVLPGLFLALLALASVPAQADTITVIPGGVWQSGAYSGTSTITATAPRSGNGSLELTGDKTRFSLGNQWIGPEIGLLKDVTSFSFDWQIAPDSVAQLNPDYTPALRLHLWDSGKYSELIWEGAYNGTYGETTKGVWYSADAAQGQLWRWVNTASEGVTFDGGSQVGLPVVGWVGGANSAGLQWYSDEAVILAISVGAGSSAGAGYHAFADNVTLGLNGVSRTWNFETETAPVPEPATLSLLGLGLVGVARAARRRKK